MSDAEPEPRAEEEPPAAPAEEQEDDVKRKFREALDRKRGNDAHAAGAGKNTSKVRGVHGSAAHQKSFRRKSG